MAEIGWIKLATSLPDNKKIKRIRKLPDGNNVILFWVFLLARAGESNKAGGLFLTDTLPYAEEDLAADFDFSIEFVKFALLTLEKYSMIDRYEEILFIKNWEKYQAVDSLEKIREQNRLRQQKYRKKQKQLTLEAPSNVIRNVTRNDEVTRGNALDTDTEKDTDKEVVSSSSGVSDIEYFFESNFGEPAQAIKDDLLFWSSQLGTEMVIEALTKTVYKQKKYTYAKGIMNNWKKLGLTTLEQVKEHEVAYGLNKEQNKPNNYNRKFNRNEQIPEWFRKNKSDDSADNISAEELQANESEIRRKMKELLGESKEVSE